MGDRKKDVKEWKGKERKRGNQGMPLIHNSGYATGHDMDCW